MLSVICPLYNEKKYIKRCIESILRQDYPADDMEVLFVDGMSTDGSRDILRKYCTENQHFRIIDNPKRIVPHAMNLAIKEAKGNVILRLDMHAEYAPNYFSTLTQKLYALNADNVGCVWKTNVLHTTPKSLAIKAVLQSPLGVGNSTFRIGADRVMEVDTVPFGCFRRDVFETYGYYDERLTRNQDIELNKRITAGGGKILLIPDALCTYFARETFSAIAHNNYQNGLWNLLVVRMKHNFSSLSLRHFVPLIFLLSLVIPALASLLWAPLLLISIASFLAYIGALAVASHQLHKSDKNLKIHLLLWTFIVLHFSYATGSLIGIFKPIPR